MPSALINKPELTAAEMEVLEKFTVLYSIAAAPFNGLKKVTLREIDIYLKYYPCYDVYYFIDLMVTIDRLVANGIDTDSKNRRGKG